MAVESYDERNREYRRAMARRRRLRLKDIPAPRNGDPWTEADDAVAMRDDIYLVEMCYLLGRSYAAVAGRRKKLLHREND